MARKKGGGGKLNRSEIIQARLDPKLHMAAEIMSRSDRRTLSSFIERVIEQAAKKHKVKRNLFFPWWSDDPELFCHDKIYSKSDVVTVDEALQDIGNEHEAIRFLKFATYFPDLLNKDEEEIFSKIIFTKYFWMHYPVTTEDENGVVISKDWHQVSALEGIVLANLIEYWPRIKSNQIKIEELDELPRGKKIQAPLKQDTLAIKKIIKTGAPTKLYKKVMVSDGHDKFLISPQDPYWKKHSIFDIAQKIEMVESAQGEQWLLALKSDLDKEEQKIWAEYCMKNKEHQEHGD
jgi:hypothetical protein